MNADIKHSIEAIAAPLACSLGLEIWGVEITGAGRPVVRIYVEGENGCNIDDCAELSRLLGLSLDVEDIMPGAYSLEVSSPGLERTFFSPRQMEKYIGETVSLILFSPQPAWPDRKKFQGELLGVEGDNITLLPADALPDAQPLNSVWENIQRARLVHDFEADKGAKPGSRQPARSKRND